MSQSRWTDNPFRRPDLTPEQLEWIKKRNEATRIFQETGDDTMAIEIGLFATEEKEGEETSQDESKTFTEGDRV